MNEKIDVAVVGATGAVGQAMLSILSERNFPVKTLYALASPKSKGLEVKYGSQILTVESLDDFDFSNTKIALFSAGGDVSSKFASKAVLAGSTVIDNTSHFRMDPSIPLVVPEVNADSLKGHNGIIANPNCSTIQMVVALKPIHDAVGISRINVATYQAVSGAGQSAINELREQTRAIINNQNSPSPRVMTKQIAFNAIPHIDSFQDNGYTREEMKMVWETQRILDAPNLLVNPTTVRIPVYFGHSEAIHIETETKISASEVTSLLNSAPGIKVIDSRSDGGYPTAESDAASNDLVYVGRIREDISHERGICLWVVADNIRKGAALNSIQIAEYLVDKKLI